MQNQTTMTIFPADRKYFLADWLAPLQRALNTAIIKEYSYARENLAGMDERR